MKCSASTCSHDAVWRVLEIRNRKMLRGDDALCEEHTKLLWRSYLSEDRNGTGEAADVSDAATFELELVIADCKCEAGTALLREVGHKRLMFLPIGFVEVCEIYYAVQDSPFNELRLHLAMKRLVEHLGGTLSHVVVDEVNPAGYFEARAFIMHNQEVIKLRIRPSDALVLAILAKLRFLVAENVLTKVAESGEFGVR